MTEKGKESTLKGTLNTGLNDVTLFSSATAVENKTDKYRPEGREINISYPDAIRPILFQMIFVLKGKVNFLQEDEDTGCTPIETHQHNLRRAGTNDNRMFLSDIQDEVLCINLSLSFVNRYLPNNHPAYRLLTANQAVAKQVMLFPFNMPVTPQINTILQFLASSTQQSFCDQLLLESKTIELLARQIEQFEQLETHTDTYKLENEERERMCRARDIVINHTGEQLSLRSLAHMVGTNEFTLKRNFKAVFGNTVYGYLKQHKMEEARSILTEKDVTVAEIAQKMGYKHATHFTSAFKKYFGYLPNKIRSGKLCLLMVIQQISIDLECLDCLLTWSTV